MDRYHWLHAQSFALGSLFFFIKMIKLTEGLDSYFVDNAIVLREGKSKGDCIKFQGDSHKLKS